jgi:hypothetical protein
MRGVVEIDSSDLCPSQPTVCSGRGDCKLFYYMLAIEIDLEGDDANRSSTYTYLDSNRLYVRFICSCNLERYSRSYLISFLVTLWSKMALNFQISSSSDIPSSNLSSPTISSQLLSMLGVNERRCHQLFEISPASAQTYHLLPVTCQQVQVPGFSPHALMKSSIF